MNKKRKMAVFSVLFLMLLGGLAYAAGVEDSPYKGREYSHKAFVKFYTNDGVNANRYIGELYCPAYVVKDQKNTGWTAVHTDDIPKNSSLYVDYFGLVNWPQIEGHDDFYLASGPDWGSKVNYLDIGETDWVEYSLNRHKIPIDMSEADLNKIKNDELKMYWKGRAQKLTATKDDPKIVYKAEAQNDPADIVSDGTYYYYILDRVDGQLVGYRDIRVDGEGMKNLIHGEELGGYAHFKLKFNLNLKVGNAQAQISGNQLKCSTMFFRDKAPYIPIHSKTTLRAYIQEEGGTLRLVKETALNSLALDLGEQDTDRQINTWAFTVNEAPKKSATVYYTINKKYENGRWIDENLYLWSRLPEGNLVESIVYGGGARESTYDDNIATVQLNLESQTPEPEEDEENDDQSVNLQAVSVQVLQDGSPVTEIEDTGIYTVRANYKIGNIKKTAPVDIRWYVLDGNERKMKASNYAYAEPNKSLTYEWIWTGSDAIDSDEVDIVAAINITDVNGTWQKLSNTEIGEEETYDDNVTPSITITAKDEETQKYQGDINHTIGGFDTGTGYTGEVIVTWTEVNIPPPPPLPRARVTAILVPPSRDSGYRSRSEMQTSRSTNGLYLKTEDINGATIQGVWIQTEVNGEMEEVFAQCDNNGRFTGKGYLQRVTMVQEAAGEKNTRQIYPKAANKWQSLSGRMDGGIYGQLNEDKKRKKTWVNYKLNDKTILVEMVNNNQFSTASKIMVDNWGNKLTTTAEFQAKQKLYVKVDNFLEPGGDGWQHINVLTGVTGFNASGGPPWMINVANANGQGYHNGKDTGGGWLNPFECHSEEEGYFLIPKYEDPGLKSKYRVSGPAPYTNSDYDHYLKETKQGRLTISRVSLENYFMPGIFLKPCFVPRYKFVPAGDNPNIGTLEETGVEPGYAFVTGDIPPPGDCWVNEAGDIVFTNNTSWAEDVKITVTASYSVCDVEKGEFIGETRVLRDELGSSRETVRSCEQTFKGTVPAGEAQTIGTMSGIMDWIGKNYPGTKEDRIGNGEYYYYRQTGPLDIKITFDEIAVKVTPDYVGEIPVAPAPKLDSRCKLSNKISKDIR
ncbi:hypothetical protein DCCM_3220 [Desulfocucumis palustris]|uniref:Uncharacterized protein n=1 Tax=Desulfocucumis palustris TaxID=1898651 RepID=A0A2L2XCY7_9FIRM|nr:hypothetical protein [Desulfocucumis palustris]GBF34108.1 hypothetical protein DCCM_3220 [Desulfocucumis palustris]